MRSVASCPICAKPAPRRPENPAYPFCSERCRLVDLGRWLGEEYRIPGGRPGDGAATPPRDVDQEDGDENA